jgi:hypothetical protein
METDSWTPRNSTVLDGSTAPLDSCPECSSHQFSAESTHDGLIFRCTNCGAGWLYELGYLRHVA